MLKRLKSIRAGLDLRESLLLLALALPLWLQALQPPYPAWPLQAARLCALLALMHGLALLRLREARQERALTRMQTEGWQRCAAAAQPPVWVKVRWRGRGYQVYRAEGRYQFVTLRGAGAAGSDRVPTDEDIRAGGAWDFTLRWNEVRRAELYLMPSVELGQSMQSVLRLKTEQGRIRLQIPGTLSEAVPLAAFFTPLQPQIVWPYPFLTPEITRQCSSILTVLQAMGPWYAAHQTPRGRNAFRLAVWGLPAIILLTSVLGLLLPDCRWPHALALLAQLGLYGLLLFPAYYSLDCGISGGKITVFTKYTTPEITQVRFPKEIYVCNLLVPLMVSAAAAMPAALLTNVNELPAFAILAVVLTATMLVLAIAALGPGIARGMTRRLRAVLFLSAVVCFSFFCGGTAVQVNRTLDFRPAETVTATLARDESVFLLPSRDAIAVSPFANPADYPDGTRFTAEYHRGALGVPYLIVDYDSAQLPGGGTG